MRASPLFSLVFLPRVLALQPGNEFHPHGANAEVPRMWTPRFLVGYELAVCNDGTPAVYYYRAGAEGSRDWVVYLDGEGWCWNAASCSGPWEVSHGTSNYIPRTAAALKHRADTWLEDGIFDRQKSPLKDAHAIFVKSCSNDAFMGDKGAPPMPPPGAGMPAPKPQPGPGWHFRGRRILEAVFMDLRLSTGLGNRDGDRLVYGGVSAGARGAMVSLDYVAKHLAGKAKTVGLLDSGMWVPVHPITPGRWTPFGQQTRDALVMANTSAFIGAECGRVYPPDENWKCLEGAWRLPFIRTPYFLAHSQYDRFAISMNVFGSFKPYAVLNKAQLNFAEQYRKQVINFLPIPGVGSGSVVFSPAIYAHGITTLARFFTIAGDGIKLSDLVRWWLETDSPEATARFRENCETFNCGLEDAVRLEPLDVALRRGQAQVGSG